MIYGKETDEMLNYLKSMGFNEGICAIGETWRAVKSMREMGLVVSFSYFRKTLGIEMNAYITLPGSAAPLHLMRKFSFHDFGYMVDSSDTPRRIFSMSHADIAGCYRTLTAKYMMIPSYSIADEIGEISEIQPL